MFSFWKVSNLREPIKKLNDSVKTVFPLCLRLQLLPTILVRDSSCCTPLLFSCNWYWPRLHNYTIRTTALTREAVILNCYFICDATAETVPCCIILIPIIRNSDSYKSQCFIALEPSPPRASCFYPSQIWFLLLSVTINSLLVFLFFWLSFFIFSVWRIKVDYV